MADPTLWGDFNGTVATDECVTGADIVLPDNTIWTIEFDVNLRVYNSFGGILGNFGHGTSARIFINGTGQLFLYNDANQAANLWLDGVLTDTDKWYRCRIECDGTDSNNLVGYLDDAPQTPTTLADTTLTFSRIGNTGNASFHHNGLLSNVRCAVTGTDIVRYDFSDQAGTTLTDQSASNNDATVNADPGTFWGSSLPSRVFNPYQGGKNPYAANANPYA